MAKRERDTTSTDAIKEEVKMELTPMIDVTFLILIVFMCTLKFKTLEGKLVSYLPTDQGLSNKPPDVPKEDAEIRIRVPRSEWDKKDPLKRVVQFMRGNTNFEFGRATGVHFGEDGRVDSFDLKPADTWEKIRDYLKNIRTTVPDAKAKINAWPQAAHVYVVKVLNLMMEEGFTDITYSGIPNDLMKRLTKGNFVK